VGQVVGQTAKEAGLKRKASVQGDVKGVLEKIGDQLEASLGGMVPKCGKCGGLFATCDNMVMAGMVKYHKVKCAATRWMGLASKAEVLRSGRRVFHQAHVS
jgi:hypothetical protein